MRVARAAAGLLTFTCLSLSTACGTLPSLSERTPSGGLPAAEAASTALGRATQPYVDAHPGLTGLLTLGDARDAFAKRMLLTRAAERTLLLSTQAHAAASGTKPKGVVRPRTGVKVTE